MNKIEALEPKKVFKYFKEICAIPHGSGNMEKIAEYCIVFAEKNNLRYVCDEAKNVIIYKDATKGYEESEPIILQGHIDMVCQKTEDCRIDFEKDGLDIYLDNGFIKANKTTLGADNGIAVSMIMAILESTDIAHPPIEAVFTTDEEIGMIGATKLDFTLLNAKRMINIDSEEQNVVTVSCAGGSEVKISTEIVRQKVKKDLVTLKIEDLKGGHSGVEIHKGRINANILAGRFLLELRKKVDFDIISLNGGDKSNAIPTLFKADLAVSDKEAFASIAEECYRVLKSEIKAREDDASIRIHYGSSGEYDAFSESDTQKIINMLVLTPNGVIDMSVEIENLVETSLNLGILKTTGNNVTMQYALRSNKKTALDYLENRMCVFAENFNSESSVFGRYEPWEYNENSALRELYAECYENKFSEKPVIEAIHAGLECAVFSGKIEGVDCISIGPDMFDVHTVKERLDVETVKNVFELLCDVLAKCK